jgi:hypothetical protein
MDRERFDRLVGDINSRLDDDAALDVTPDVDATYRSINVDALVNLRAAFTLDRDRPDATVRLRAFAQARIDLITRILEKKGR